MTNIAVDGFATYGEGTTMPGDTVGLAMLAGVWAELPLDQVTVWPNPTLPTPQIGQLPWAPLDPDLYISRCLATYVTQDSSYVLSSCYRRVLPSASDPVVMSAYYAVSALPISEGAICGFADVNNTVMAWLVIGSTGALFLRDAANAVTLAQTGGPVIVAETANHIEMEFSAVAGTFTLNVNETAVISAVGLTIAGAASVAQVRIFPATTRTNKVVYPAQYMSNLIFRNKLGTLNNAIMGDRRVATLLMASDDATNQGWTPHYLKKFGVSILDLTDTSGTSGPNVNYAETVVNSTKIGVSDFTLEAQVRFKALPSGTTVATIMSSWADQAESKDWRLALGSQSYNGAQLIFEASPDGVSNNVQTLFTYPWDPTIGKWHHVVANRVGGVLAIYIDGVQLGPVITDTMTYGYTNKGFILGDATSQGGSSSNPEDVQLWMDDVRITIGSARYTTNFAPITAALPTDAGGDASWADVQLRVTFDAGDATDLSASAHTFYKNYGAVIDNPLDGDAAYQTIDGSTPDDIAFISADFIPASGTFTFAAVPSAGDTITLATKDGIAAAVYTWQAVLASAYDVLIGATTADSSSNLVAAINNGAGEGTVYGTGTLANNDVVAYANPGSLTYVVADVAGTIGNALASTVTGAAGTWTATTLAGGVDIPAYSQFRAARLPSDATRVDSVTIAARMLKTDAGIATVQSSLVGNLGGVASGTNHSVATTATVYMDTLENDPDNVLNPLSPTILTQSLVRINRTT